MRVIQLVFVGTGALEKRPENDLKNGQKKAVFGDVFRMIFGPFFFTGARMDNWPERPFENHSRSITTHRKKPPASSYYLLLRQRSPTGGP